MKKIFLVMVVLILILQIHSVFSAEDNARLIIDSLYQTEGTLPISDMIIELEMSAETLNSDTGAKVIEQTSKDKVYFKMPNKLRVDSTFIDPNGPWDGKYITIIRDGKNRWMYISNGQFPVKAEKDTPTPSNVVPFSLQKFAQDNENEYVLLGKEVVDGAMATIVSIINPNDPEIKITAWIDTAKKVPLKIVRYKRIEYKDKDDNDKKKKKLINYQILYKNIKQLKDGRYMPTLIEVYTPDNKIEQILTYKKVSINVGLADSLFEPMKKMLQ